MPRIILWPLLSVGVIASLPVHAQMPNPETVPALNELRSLSAKIDPLEEVGGLNAWAVTRNGQAGVLYTSRDGRYLVQGMIFDAADPAKTSITVRHQQQATAIAQQSSAPVTQSTLPSVVSPPAAPPNRAEAFWSELVAAPGIEWAAPGRPNLLMVVDPTCPYCLATWRELAPMVGKTVAVKLILIAGADQSSAQLAAWLLNLPSDAARRAWNELAMGVPSDEARQVAQGRHQMPTTSYQKIQENAQLAQRRNISGTPFLAYRSGAGAIRVLTGKPDNISAVLAEMQP